MKKVAIVTLVDLRNFGNRLQNYAVQEVLESLGLLPETLRFPQISKTSSITPTVRNPLSTAKKIAKKVFRLLKSPLNTTKKVFRLLKSPLNTTKKVFRLLKRPSNTVKRVFRFLKNLLKKEKEKADNTNTQRLIEKREANFKLFNHNIKWSTYSLQDNFPAGYDYYLIGSDQVWNVSWYDGYPWAVENTFLLTFAPPEKKICFSPSFGISKLPDEWIPFFKEQLSKFNKISVREDAGAAIVKELTGKNAEVLIDSTCMLDTDKWMNIAKPPKGFHPAKPYILAYFLGDLSDRINQDLQNYANTYNLCVCNVLDMTRRNLFVSGPSEFIWLIAHAKLVLTDSFHGSIFSFLFGKPFLVYTRCGTPINTISRIETLLRKFDLLRKFVDSGLPNDLWECDYQKGYEQLKKEREKVKRFLLESFNQ